jgi:hypothetical protein
MKNPLEIKCTDIKNFCDEFTFLSNYNYLINNEIKINDYYNFVCDFIKIVKIYYSKNEEFKNKCKKIITKLLNNSYNPQLNDVIKYDMFTQILLVIINKNKNNGNFESFKVEINDNIYQSYLADNVDKYSKNYNELLKVFHNHNVLKETILQLKILNNIVNLIPGYNMVSIGKLMVNENLFVENSDFSKKTRILLISIIGMELDNFRNSVDNFVLENQGNFKIQSQNDISNFIKEVYGLEFLLEGYKIKYDLGDDDIVQNILKKYNNISDINNHKNVFKLITCISIMKHLDCESDNCKNILELIYNYLGGDN